MVSAEVTEGKETATPARRKLQHPRSEVEVARARGVRGGMLGRAGNVLDNLEAYV